MTDLTRRGFIQAMSTMLGAAAATASLGLPVVELTEWAVGHVECELERHLRESMYSMLNQPMQVDSLWLNPQTYAELKRAFAQPKS